MDKTLGFELWDKLDQFIGKKILIERVENVSEDHYSFSGGEWEFSWNKNVQRLITYEAIVERVEVDTLVLTRCRIVNPAEINVPHPSHTRFRLFMPDDGRMIFSASLCKSIVVAE